MPLSPGRPPTSRRVKRRSLIDWPITKTALKQAFIMLRPDVQWNNPVMFVVEVGAVLTLCFTVQAAVGKSVSQILSAILSLWMPGYLPRSSLRTLPPRSRSPRQGAGGIPTQSAA